jgi:hypothetical protein
MASILNIYVFTPKPVRLNESVYLWIHIGTKSIIAIE